MNIAKNFHEKSKNQGEWVIDIWTYAEFDALVTRLAAALRVWV